MAEAAATDVSLLQDRSKILAVVQGGVLKAGTMTKGAA